jgi:hypothetical protein
MDLKEIGINLRNWVDSVERVEIKVYRYFLFVNKPKSTLYCFSFFLTVYEYSFNFIIYSLIVRTIG